MAEVKVALPFVFGLVGGTLIVVIPLALLPFATGYSGGPFIFGPFGAIAAVAAGAIVIIAASMTYKKPSEGMTWGITMVIFGAASILGTGGFVVGMALAITGGALAIVVGAPPVTEPDVRACTACGRLYPSQYAYCPYCGHAAEAA
jgi:hypothetical protein